MDLAVTDPPVKLSILLPVRNERLNLNIMLKLLRATVEVPHEVLVVYDTPDDDSVAAVAAMQVHYPNLRAVHNTLGRGIPSAIRAGVHVATGEYVLIFAADEVGPVLAIEDMLALMDQGCDLVSCTRYAYGGRRLGGSWIGGVLSRLANRLFCWAGSALSDCTTGIKLFRRSIFDNFDLQAKPVGWVVAFEMAIKAQLLGLRLGEVPVISIDRLYGGKSTFQLGLWTIEYLKWFMWGLRRLRRQGRGRSNPALVRIPTMTPVGGKPHW